MRRIRTWQAALIAALVLGALLAACSDDSKDDKASDATPTTSDTQVMTDNKFSKTRIIVPASQPITVQVQNNGAAIHNWHVLNVKDAAGQDVTTALLNAGQSATATFTLSAPGTYDFQCDTHPAEMRGKLTVQ